MTADLDDPARVEALRQVIRGKRALEKWYVEAYEKFAKCLSHCPSSGIALEMGSGGGFVKEIVADMTTSDILPYRGVDFVTDARRMAFANASLRGIFMLNVLHHIPDVERFLVEAARCLKPGGRMYMVDQYPGWISSPVYKYLHHEPFDPKAETWAFASQGPLSGANGALASIVFERDREKFEKRFPCFRILRYAPHSPLRYWIAGGLKKWSLLPGCLFSTATRLDRMLCGLSKRFGSFVDIELLRTDEDAAAS